MQRKTRRNSFFLIIKKQLLITWCDIIVMKHFNLSLMKYMKTDKGSN